MWIDICTIDDGMGMNNFFGGDGRGWGWIFTGTGGMEMKSAWTGGDGCNMCHRAAPTQSA